MKEFIEDIMSLKSYDQQMKLRIIIAPDMVDFIFQPKSFDIFLISPKKHMM